MVLKLKGAQCFRQRILLSTLSGTALQISDIHAMDSSPGMAPHEVSFMRLIEKITNGCVVNINETGTKLLYKPGVLVGGRNIVHECESERGIGYFLEPLLILGLFGKKPLSIKLRGITNSCLDPCVDTFRITTLPMLERFGVPTQGLELKINARGAPPAGGGEVLLNVPMVDSLKAVQWTDEGMVKRIRGVSYAAGVSPQMTNRMITAARAILNIPLADVKIFADHRKAKEAGLSRGFGISLVAETTSGCRISAECTKSQEHELPEDLGTEAAKLLFQEIKHGGVVDSAHQGLLFILCALCPEDISKIRVGKLSAYGIQTLRSVKELLGVQFDIHADQASGTVILKCVGSGFRNLNRKIG